MNIESEYYDNLSKFISSTKFNLPEDYLDRILESFQSIQKIDFESVLKNLPTTRKSTTPTAIKNLKKAHEAENLNLVVGAGVSKPYGIPTWDYLLQRLLLKTLEETPEKAVVLSKVFTKLFNPSPLIAGRYLQESLSDLKDKNRFEKEVRRTLYESFDKNASSQIMDEIVKLCAAPGNSPNLDGIITYNYDDIIETKIREKNMDIPFQSVYGQGIDPDNRALAIYHVHGFLPQEGAISELNNITLSEYVYHEQYSNIYSWNNIVQINKFRDKTCLFIGTSLSDPNIRRLLDIANSQKKGRKFHYIIKKKPSRSWVSKRLKKILDDNSEIFNEKVKAKLDFEETIDFLIEIQNRFEEKDSESLGVKTVWIDEYDSDIANILKRIRE
ncbi:SIR2 family protein [Pontibacter indicus]|uniref:SIR2-like domain-containing protein n=1 Tax=Pontibacter indicus TaxID=1317125 RepID=A0A1R3XKW2_9BACT|nr:SIR2 family protein [Pontibacter indicus]SIT92280.1 SIR2-like domain-containing protein [Pontibacter indicus]